VTIVAEAPSSEILNLAGNSLVTVNCRRFRPEDMEGAFLVFAATGDTGVNAEIAALARERNILVNAVDDPERCDFISGAVMKRGPLRIAVSTSGCGPLIASRIRDDIEKRYDESFGTYITLAGEIRDYILSKEVDEERKKMALALLADEKTCRIFLRHGKEKVWERILKMLTSF